MQMDSQGWLWLLYEGKGIGYLMLDSGIVYQVLVVDLLMVMSFIRLVVDVQDWVWVGMLDGLVLCDNDGVFKCVFVVWGLGVGSGLLWFYCVLDGVLWIVVGECLYWVEDDQLVLVYCLLGQLYMILMLQDWYGDLWLGIENQGLLCIFVYGLE